MWIAWYGDAGDEDTGPYLVWVCPFNVPLGNFHCGDWPRCERPGYRGDSCTGLASEALADLVSAAEQAAAE